MNIPLPAAPGPGGVLLDALTAQNAYRNALHTTEINRVKAQYAPLTTQAEAASKFAYSNLVGLQPLAKILQNDPAFQNLSPSQQQGVIDRFYKAGTGQGFNAGLGGNAINWNPPERQSLGTRLTNALLDKIGLGNNQNQNQPSNQLNNIPGNGAPNLQYIPNENPQFGGTNDTLSSSENPQNYISNNNVNHLNKVESEPNVTYQQPYVTSAEDVDNLTPEQKQQILNDPNAPQHLKDAIDYNKKAGKAAGIRKQEEQAGTYRSEDVHALDQQFEQEQALDQPYSDLKRIITNPKFRNLKKAAGFQQLQMNSKALIGDEEEQNLIGEFRAAAREVVNANVKGFGGRILASEIPLSEKAKIGENETIGVVSGKLPALLTYHQLRKDRSELASKIMQKEYISKGDALRKADKELNGDKIREGIKKELDSYPVEIKNKKTGEVKTVTAAEARKLGVPNV